MWSLRCLLSGHDDMLLRRPHRLSLECRHCGRETHGWSWSRADQEGAMNRRVDVGAGVAAVRAAGWVLVRVLDWHRRLRASQSRTAPEEI